MSRQTVNARLPTKGPLMQESVLPLHTPAARGDILSAVSSLRTEPCCLRPSWCCTELSQQLPVTDRVASQAPWECQRVACVPLRARSAASWDMTQCFVPAQCTATLHMPLRTAKLGSPLLMGSATRAAPAPQHHAGPRGLAARVKTLHTTPMLTCTRSLSSSGTSPPMMAMSTSPLATALQMARELSTCICTDTCKGHGLQERKLHRWMDMVPTTQVQT